MVKLTALWDMPHTQRVLAPQRLPLLVEAKWWCDNEYSLTYPKPKHSLDNDVS